MIKRMNLNSKVKVKLNDKGVSAFYHRYDNLEGIPQKTPVIDKEGFTEFQLWDLMRLIGPFCYVGGDRVIEQDSLFIELQEMETIE